MTDITPPPELVQQWFDIWQGSDDDDVAFADFVVVRASQYGANQELEACCDVLENDLSCFVSADLRAARRPKPPSLKQEALEALSRRSTFTLDRDRDTIRRALEALPDE